MAQRFVRQSGTSRRYLDTKTGEIVSRVERDKRASRDGLRKPVDIVRLAEQRRKQARYQSLVQSYQDKQAASGKRMAKKDIRTNPQFKKAVEDLNAGNERSKKARAAIEAAKTPAQKAKAEARLRSANDQLRRALEKLGRREGLPSWVPVGLSDRRRKGQIRSPANLPRIWRNRG